MGGFELKIGVVEPLHDHSNTVYWGTVFGKAVSGGRNRLNLTTKCGKEWGELCRWRHAEMKCDGRLVRERLSVSHEVRTYDSIPARSSRDL